MAVVAWGKGGRAAEFVRELTCEELTGASLSPMHGASYLESWRPACPMRRPAYPMHLNAGVGSGLGSLVLRHIGSGRCEAPGGECEACRRGVARRRLKGGHEGRG